MCTNKSYQTIANAEILNKLEIFSFVATCPTTCRVTTILSITFLITTACGLCKFPVAHSQGKSPSSKGLSHIDWYLWQPRTIDLYKTCKLSFHTFIQKNTGYNTAKLNCKRYFPYSNSPNFISPKVVQQTIHQIFLPPKFPSIRYMTTLKYFYLEYLSLAMKSHSLGMSQSSGSRYELYQLLSIAVYSVPC